MVDLVATLRVHAVVLEGQLRVLVSLEEFLVKDCFGVIVLIIFKVKLVPAIKILFTIIRYPILEYKQDRVIELVALWKEILA